MDYKNTNLFFLQEDCVNIFGEDKGNKIFIRSEELLDSMLAKADFKNNDSIKNHMSTNMLPVIAFYKSLQESGFSKEEAYNLTLTETQKWAHVKEQRNKKMLKIPFTYSFFRLVVKSFMKKSFPVEGWETEWVRRDGKEIHFNLKRCIYIDITKECDCAELCQVFCKNDDVAFRGYEPKIYFHRNGTLANGDKCCDFHFTRSK
ncbi:MAG: L-2-amino-thiazoline-4-carboxylic acid hydrolase [Treponema sp.]|nr:L-2-amino-thiazoline-4-carboxylic acid hydrolase [Treponema sp.]